jgi:hypothetical protein
LRLHKRADLRRASLRFSFDAPFRNWQSRVPRRQTARLKREPVAALTVSVAA